MTRPFFAAVAMLAFALAGCQHNYYVLEITPEGNAIQRVLTCWQQVDQQPPRLNPLPADELARIEKLYGKPPAGADKGKRIFRGRFTGKTPADVGGAGSYTHFASPLGTLSAYAERFRGNDDPEALWAKRRAAVDQLIDLVLGWLESELKADPNFPKLRQFLDKDLRYDLKNIAFYVLAGNSLEGQKGAERGDPWARAAQYLYERGYFTPKEVPMLVRAAESSDPAALLAVVQRFLAGKMGVAPKEPIPPSLAFLADAKRVEQSWNGYVRTTELFKKRQADWEKEQKKEPNPKPPLTPEQLLENLIVEAFLDTDVLFSANNLEVKLACGVEPFATNGQWDAKDKAVTWKASLSKDKSPPEFCYAFWSEPNPANQEKHFGKVVLAGEALAEYLLWYRGLTPDEMRQWDALVAGLKPAMDAKKALDEFRFGGPAQGKPTKSQSERTETPKRLILEGLRGKPK